MKKYFIILFLFITILIGCSGTKENFLRIEGLKRTYAKKEKIDIRINNLTQINVFYDLSIQQKIDNKWRIYTPCVECPDREHDNVLLQGSIKPNEIITVSWATKSPGAYRAFADFVLDPNNRYLLILTPNTTRENFEYQRIYSKEFIIEE